LIKENESPTGPYMVYNDRDGNPLASVGIQDYTILPFPSLDAIFPPEASVPLPDAGWVYEQNLHQTLLAQENLNSIIPSPASQTRSGEIVFLEEGLMIHYNENLKMEAEYLAEMIEAIMGFSLKVMEGTHGGPNIIRLSYNQEIKNMGPEAYLLNVEPAKGITITGGSAAGVFYGIQSLLSMLPVKAWKKSQSKIELEAVSITDKPAFKYRGMHLDIARNFIEPPAIKKLIQAMAYYKLNKLHLHLTDDESWRLEIPSLPELTWVGGRRGHTLDDKNYQSPAYGSGPDPDPGASHGSGFLSRESFIEILRFASEHHIEVIPEINFPGHARAAIYAMESRYDRHMNEGKEDEALFYRLIDPEDNSDYNSAQNFTDNVICVCQEAPYRFFETVVDEVIEMYKEAGLTLKVFHTGGDEVPHGSWTGSPVCHNFLKNHPKIGEVENLQPYLEGRLFEILQRKNLVMAGWEEIGMKKNEKGKWIPNPEFVGGKMVPYVWNSEGDYLDLGNRMANAGFPIVLCNVTNFYFDLAYNHHPMEPGHYWGGFVNTRRAFEFIPFNVFNSTLNDRYWRAIETEGAFSGLEELKPEAQKNILGIQGELWSEFVKGGEMMEYFYMPKLIGLAERAWVGQQSWGSVENIEKRVEAMNLAWNDFANVVGQREMPRLDYLFGGFNYRLPPPGAMIMDGQIYANTDFPGLTIRYTMDGSEPGPDSPVYESPVKALGKVQLRTFDTRGRGSRVTWVENYSSN